MRTIRHDLERVRILLELIKKRERAKREIVEVLSQWFELSCDPVHHSLSHVLNCLYRYKQHWRANRYNLLTICFREDKREIFHNPVTTDIAPGYFDVVKNPMDLTTMRQKLEEGKYSDPKPFWVCFTKF